MTDQDFIAKQRDASQQNSHAVLTRVTYDQDDISDCTLRLPGLLTPGQVFDFTYFTSDTDVIHVGGRIDYVSVVCDTTGHYPRSSQAIKCTVFAFEREAATRSSPSSTPKK